MFQKFTIWVIPLILMLFLGNGCQLVSKRDYRQATTELNRVQQSVNQQSATIEKLKKRNAELQSVNTAMRSELRQLSAIMGRIKEGRAKEGRLAKKAVRFLKKKNRILHQRLASLSKKRGVERKKTPETVQEPNPSTMPKVVTPSREKIVEKPPAVAPPQSKSKSTALSKELKASSLTSQKVAPEVSKSDLKEVQVQKKQLTSSDSRAASLTEQSSTSQVDVNNSTAEEMMTRLGITEDLAEKIVANRPYRFPAELVLRGALTREIYRKVSKKVLAKE